MTTDRKPEGDVAIARGAKLGLLGVYCTAAGAMISSGIFVLPGLAFAYVGPAVIVSYFLAGLLAATGMLSQAELVSAMPKAGGTYFFVMRSMGPAVGVRIRHGQSHCSMPPTGGRRLICLEVGFCPSSRREHLPQR